MKSPKLITVLTLVASAVIFHTVRAVDSEGYAKEGTTGSVEGIARDTVIHSCNRKLTAENPGWCNGTLRIEYTEGGKTRTREVIVTSRVAIVVDGKSPGILSSFEGEHVKVNYVDKDGLNYATSVVATKEAPKE